MKCVVQCAVCSEQWAVSSVQWWCAVMVCSEHPVACGSSKSPLIPALTSLHCTTLNWTVLRSAAVCYTALYNTVLHCDVLCCSEMHCTTLHCSVLYCAAVSCTVLHCTAHCTVYSTALWSHGLCVSLLSNELDGRYLPWAQLHIRAIALSANTWRSDVMYKAKMSLICLIDFINGKLEHLGTFLEIEFLLGIIIFILVLYFTIGRRKPFTEKVIKLCLTSLLLSLKAQNSTFYTF